MIRILIVDDDEKYLNSLVDALEVLGRFKIYYVTKSKDAFKFINDGGVDVLITDYLLKNDVLNGDKIIRTVRDKERQDGYQAYLPCILMTGSEGERQMVAKLIDLKSSFYSKADDVTLLVDKIEDSWREKQAREKPIMISNNQVPSAFSQTAITTSRRNCRMYRYVSSLFVGFPRIVGRVLLDVIGRDKATETTAIIVGYAIIVTAVLIFCGAVDYKAIISTGRIVWLFFSPAK